MRVRRPLRLRHLVVAVGLLLVSLIAWAAVERTSCHATLAKFDAIQHIHNRDDVHRMLGTPNQVFIGADVLRKLFWGSDVALGQNEGEVVIDERYTHGGFWCRYLIVIGYGPDGNVRSKFLYD